MSRPPVGPAPDAGSSPDERVETSFQTDRPLVKPGGKVDPDAVRAAVEAARARRGEAGEDAGDDDELPAVTFTLQRDLKTRLDKYLTTRVTFMSRTQLQRHIESGGVTVNEQPAKASLKLGKGDRVRLVIPEPPATAIVPEDIPLEVLFEDEDLIVINKAADIIVHPARAALRGTMINALAWRFKHVSGGELSAVGDEFARPGVVHRLDRDTTGCIVFAKRDETHWKLSRQWEHRTVDKRYLAVVHGSPERDTEVIDLPLGPHPSREKGYREKQVVRRDDQGKASLTIMRVRERYRLHERAVGDQHFALVELELKTGRTHQIRVHLSHMGWAIVGDDMYGGRFLTLPEREGEAEHEVRRQMLHAALLAFEHPRTDEAMIFAAPPHGEMRRLIAYLRTGAVEPVHVEGTVPLSRLGL
ncbi:MAG: RluA family pseudouridine synthase [Phycisphaerales bacterium]|nr:MAG: RluA family pseudouridine synthase [Phycisphaerales bacterium]